MPKKPRPLTDKDRRLLAIEKRRMLKNSPYPYEIDQFPDRGVKRAASPSAKQPLRDQLEITVEDYLNKGGAITIEKDGIAAGIERQRIKPRPTKLKKFPRQVGGFFTTKTNHRRPK